MGDVADHRTWNVFRRRDAHGLCCAVSADAPIPTFLLTGDWTFGFQVARGDPPVPGFSPPSAEIGARYNGFYLFLGFGSRLMTRRLGGVAWDGSRDPASPSPRDGRDDAAAPDRSGLASFQAPQEVGGEPNDGLAHSTDAEPRLA